MPQADTPQQKPDVAHGHTSSWRDHEPAIVHSLKWHDGDGIKHLHVVRAGTLDEVLLHIRKVKACIDATRAKHSPTQSLHGCVYARGGCAGLLIKKNKNAEMDKQCRKGVISIYDGGCIVH